MDESSIRMPFPRNGLLGIDGLTKDQVHSFFSLADRYFESNRGLNKHSDVLRGRTIFNLFYENSTRTLVSFELAGKRLGADVVSIAVANSSTSKGETLLDTAATLSAMNPDILVLRHNESGAAKMLAEKVSCAVINAGDGANEHPTQALLDGLVIKHTLGHLEGVRVAICGDIAHSRVARSNILLLNMMGAEIHVIAPPTLLPDDIDAMGVSVFHDLLEGLAGCDIVMTLRIQKERMQLEQLPSLRDYYEQFAITHESLKFAKPNAMVMHPGPINRDVEISGALADDPTRSLVRKQVEMGVALRMAVLEMVGRASRIKTMDEAKLRAIVN